MVFPLIVLLGCVSNPHVDEDEAPLLIGDGSVQIDKVIPATVEERRAIAQFKGEHERFTPTQFDLRGKAWVEEVSEYALNPELTEPVHCEVRISREDNKRQPNSIASPYTYLLEVKVKDGIKGGPFESLINGEGEGSLFFGEFPVNELEASETMVINETVILSWSYDPEKRHYEIVKQMGEDRFLRKVIKFDAYLRLVTKVQFQILKGDSSQGADQMTPLAKVTCS